MNLALAGAGGGGQEEPSPSCSVTRMPPFAPDDIAGPTPAPDAAEPGVHHAEIRAGRLTVTVTRAEMPLDRLCAFATRRNPKRAFLFVSRVLGRHLPVPPATIRATWRALAQRLPGDLPGPVAFVGMAETAVALGCGVFAEWRRATGRDDALYLHSTRYRLDRPLLDGFREDHSHAADHLLYRPDTPEAAERLAAARSLVLVDDERTTGATFRNLAAALAPACPRLDRVAAAVLTDWSADPAQTGAWPDAVSLLAGHVAFAPRPGHTAPAAPALDGDGAVKPFLTRNDGRLGILEPPVPDPAWLDGPAAAVAPGDRVLVLGTGEFVFPPILLAEALAARGAAVWCQATTRSPILPGDAIARTLRFADNYADGIENYLYNADTDAYDRVLICTETPPALVDPALVAALGAEIVAMGGPA